MATEVKNTLRKKAEYPDKMPNGDFCEASGSATFPEDDLDSFDRLLKWAYYGIISSNIYWRVDGTWKRDWCPLKLYVLADKLNIPEITDRAMDAYTTAMTGYSLLPRARRFTRRLWLDSGKLSTEDVILRHVHLPAIAFTILLEERFLSNGDRKTAWCCPRRSATLKRKRACIGYKSNWGFAYLQISHPSCRCHMFMEANK